MSDGPQRNRSTRPDSRHPESSQRDQPAGVFEWQPQTLSRTERSSRCVQLLGAALRRSPFGSSRRCGYAPQCRRLGQGLHHRSCGRSSTKGVAVDRCVAAQRWWRHRWKRETPSWRSRGRRESRRRSSTRSDVMHIVKLNASVPCPPSGRAATNSRGHGEPDAVLRGLTFPIRECRVQISPRSPRSCRSGRAGASRCSPGSRPWSRCRTRTPPSRPRGGRSPSASPRRREGVPRRRWWARSRR